MPAFQHSSAERELAELIVSALNLEDVALGMASVGLYQIVDQIHKRLQ